MTISGILFVVVIIATPVALFTGKIKEAFIGLIVGVISYFLIKYLRNKGDECVVSAGAVICSKYDLSSKQAVELLLRSSGLSMVNFITKVWGEKKEISDMIKECHVKAAETAEDGAAQEREDRAETTMEERTETKSDEGLDRAAELFKSVVDANEDGVEREFIRAAGLHALNDASGARESYKELIKNEPYNLEAHACLIMLLCSAAIKIENGTGVKFTLYSALQKHGYYLEVRESLSICNALVRTGDDDNKIKEHFSFYQTLLGLGDVPDRLLGGIERKESSASQRPSSYWLSRLGFKEELFIKSNFSSIAESVKSAVEEGSLVFVLAHGQTIKNISRYFKTNKRIIPVSIGPTMNDDKVKEILGRASAGEIILADIERVALGSEFSWVQDPSCRKTDLILVEPDSMLLPELFGAVLKTSLFGKEGAEQRYLFVNIKKNT